MVVLDDDVLIVVAFDILAVDLGAGVLALTERADIKIVVQNAKLFIRAVIISFILNLFSF